MDIGRRLAGLWACGVGMYGDALRADQPCFDPEQTSSTLADNWGIYSLIHRQSGSDDICSAGTDALLLGHRPARDFGDTLSYASGGSGTTTGQ